MNYNLPFVPARPAKPRQAGLTMMMDKGLSLREAENFIEAAAPYTDLVKFGFGTALLTNKLEEKIKLYRSANITPYFGGTLFEAFAVRGLFDEYCRFLDKYKMDTAEISDGSMQMPHEEKLNYIQKLSKQVTVLSEVGSKQAGVVIPTDKWINMMKAEFEAGSWKVITEARESGNIGIYKSDGSANKELIDDILKNLNPDDILWEAPLKQQQVWFIKLLGPNVSLGNIAVNDVIPLETLRLGLRGDTFNDYLNK
jgi:phosphosulfolactate synthase